MTTKSPRRILVPIELTDTSRAGLRAAADLAARFDAHLTVLHVEMATAVLTDVMAGPTPTPGVTDAAARQLDAVRKRVEEFARDVLGPDHDATILSLEGIFVADAIVRFARERDQDLICMGAGGKTGWRRFFLGSTTAEVVRRSTVPVLTLRGRTEEAREFVFDDFRRVLLATDLDEGAEHVLELARLLATPKGTLTVMHVIETPVPVGLYGVPLQIPAESLGAAREWTEGGLERLTKDVDRKVLEPFRIVTGRAASAILAVEEELQPDVTVVGTHGRHGLERLMLGSVAERVIARATGPVLVVPGAKKA